MFRKTLVTVLFAFLVVAAPAGASATPGAIVFSRVWHRLPLGPDGEPVPEPPEGGLFAFEHGAVVQLTADPADHEPSFSADGQTIAFVRDGDVWAMRADGTGQRRLTSGVETDSRPLVAPNGRYVLFERNTRENRAHDLYTTDLRGGLARPLTATPADEREAAFSADGRQIVYARRGKDEKGDIWSIQPSGAEMRRLTHTPRVNEFSPRYLDKTIVFTRGSNKNWSKPKTYAAIYAMNRRGGRVHELVTRAPWIRLEDVTARTRTILFHRPRGLWVKQLGGRSRKIVSFSKRESSTGVFSPNGRRIAALSWELWGQSLSVIDASTGHRAYAVAGASNAEGGEGNSIIGPIVAWQPVPHR